MLTRVVTADGAICEGSGEYEWVGDVEEVGDVERGGREAVENAD